MVVRTSPSRTNFNSIKVRLELQNYLNPTYYVQFQFHKGTIRTFLIYPIIYQDIIFQFHKGTIRTLLALCNEIPLFDFNSIKVRLEPSIMQMENKITQFQFHKGTIRTTKLP